VSDAYEGEQRLVPQTVPNDSLEEFWLELKSFNVCRTSKSGCGGVEKQVATIGNPNTFHTSSD
jgi:hypothetical protein